MHRAQISRLFVVSPPHADLLVPSVYPGMVLGQVVLKARDVMRWSQPAHRSVDAARLHVNELALQRLRCMADVILPPAHGVPVLPHSTGRHRSELAIR